MNIPLLSTLFGTSTDDEGTYAVLPQDEYFQLDSHETGYTYWKDLNAYGWAVATEYFNEAYETGDDSKAVQWVEEEVAPIHRYMHTDHGPVLNDLPEPGIDLDHWYREIAADHDTPPQYARFKILPGSDTYSTFRNAVEAAGFLEDYNHIVGVYAGGMPFIYTISDLIDTDPILVKYSHRKDRDEGVHITETMNERLDIDGGSVLIVDDDIASGKTMNVVTEWLTDRGAGSVGALSGSQYKLWDEWRVGEDDLESGHQFAIDLQSRTL